MKTYKTHQDLNVWKGSMKLVKDIYKITESFPKREIYGLTSQIRRCAISIPSNISEGSARNKKNEFIRFLQISQGSLSELETQLIISKDLEYISFEIFKEIIGNLNKIRAQLCGLIHFIQNQIDNQ